MQTLGEVRDHSIDRATTEDAFRAWPLIFTYKGNVFGRGFIASIHAVSRILGVWEDDGIWLSGVQPGGMAAGGKDIPAAYTDLRNTFLGILADIASTADTYEAFRAEVERFFDERDETAMADWNAAVAAYRSLPTGRRGARRPMVQVFHIRKMVNHLGISPACADEYMS